MTVRTGRWIAVSLLLAFTTLAWSHGANAYPSQHQASSQESLALATKTYLPVVVLSPTATVTFGTTIDSNGVPNPPLTVLPAGSRKLYYNAAIRAAQGKPYRLEWSINGQRQPGIDHTGTVPSNSANINGLICVTATPTCDNPTGTLPTGTYLLRVFVDNVLITEGTVTVAASLDGSTTEVGTSADFRRE